MYTVQFACIWPASALAGPLALYAHSSSAQCAFYPKNWLPNPLSCGHCCWGFLSVGKQTEFYLLDVLMAGSKIKWHSLSAHAFSLHFSVLQIIQMINTEIQISKTETLLVKRLLSCIFCCYLHFAKHSQNLSGSGSNKMKLRPQPWNCSLLTTKIGDLTIAFVVFQFFCVFRKQETQDMHWGLFVVVKWPLESLPLFFFFWFFISGFCKQDVGASLFG